MKRQRGLALAAVALCLACGSDSGTTARLTQIGELGGATEEEYAFVLEYLEHGNAEQRAAAAWAAGEILRDSAVPPLLDALRTDGDVLVRLNACVSLGRFSGDEVQQALVETLDSDDPQLQAAALRALAQPHFSGAATAVGRVFETGDADTRALALETLVAMGGPETRAALERVADDPDEEVRSVAAFSLGKLRDPSAVPVLAGLLEDPSWQVRANAAQALGMIGEPSSRSLLESLLEDSNEQVRLVAESALDRLE